MGTILSLMVFLTFIGMFTNQYVPIWMKENENNHMNQVVGQISALKSGIDMQVLNNNNQIASAPIYSPIQLHAEGVPVFASATAGQLSFTSQSAGDPYCNITYTYFSGGVRYTLGPSNGGQVGGSLEFYGPNRYFIQQNVTYENGAVILHQSDGETVLSGMAVRVVNYSGQIIVKITLTSLSGVNKTIGGFGTKSITSTLEYTTYTKMENANGGYMNLTIVSKYPDAWSKYFNDLKTKVQGGVASAGWVVSAKSLDARFPGQGYYKITFSIKGVNVLEYTKAVATMTIADIGV